MYLLIKAKSGGSYRVDPATISDEGIAWIRNNALPISVKSKDGQTYNLDPQNAKRSSFDWIKNNAVEYIKPQQAETTESPLFSVAGLKERGYELTHPGGGVGGAVSRLGLGAFENLNQLGHGVGMLAANILPAEMEGRVQESIKGSLAEDMAKYERRMEASGGRDIYSGIGALIPDVAMIAAGGGLAAKAPGIASWAAKTIPQRMAKGAALEGLTGLAYESVKEGSLLEGAKQAPYWAAFGAAGPVAGAVLKRGGAKVAGKLNLPERMRKLNADWVSSKAVLEKLDPSGHLGVLWNRMKGASDAGDTRYWQSVGDNVLPHARDDAGKFMGEIYDESAVYAQAQHIVNLNSRFPEMELGGKKTISNAYSNLKRIGDMKKTSPDQFAKIKSAAEGWQRMGDELIDKTVEAGNLAPAEGAFIKRYYPFYSPLHREHTIEELSKAGFSRASALKRMRGSERQILGLEGNIYRNFRSMEQWNREQQYKRDVLDWIASSPYAGLLDKSAKQVKELDISTIISQPEKSFLPKNNEEAAQRAWEYFRKPPDIRSGDIAVRRVVGDKTKWEVHRIDTSTVDGEILQKSLNEATVPQQFAALVNFGRKLKEVKRFGITAVPEFMLRNNIKDTVVAVLRDRTVNPWIAPANVVKRFLYENPVSFLRVVKGMRGGDKFYSDIMLGGGGMQGVGRETLAVTAGASKNLQKELRKKASGSNIILDFGEAIKPGNWLKTIDRFGMTLEQVNRFTSANRTYKSLTKKGLSHQAAMEKAVAEYRGLADFADMGFTAKQVGWVTPFFTAAFAGMSALGRAYKRDPYGTSIKIMNTVIAPTVGIWLLNKTDPERKAVYDGLTPMEKNLYWYVGNVGKNRVMIPKPFEAGALASVIERLMDTAHSADPQNAVEVMGALRTAFPSWPVPMGATTIAGLWGNKDPFFKTPVVPKSLEGLPKYLQSKPSTSAPAKAVGKAIGVSPAQVDWVVSDLFGGLGREAMRQTTGAARALSPGKEVVPAKELSDLPGLRAIFKKHPEETTYSGNINRFYDNFQRTQTTHKEVNTLLKAGKREDAVRVMKEKKRDYLFYSYFNNIGGSIRKLMARYKEIADPEKHTYMTPKQKRETMRNIALQINKLAKRGNEKYEAYDGK